MSTPDLPSESDDILKATFWKILHERKPMQRWPRKYACTTWAIYGEEEEVNAQGQPPYDRDDEQQPKNGCHSTKRRGRTDWRCMGDPQRCMWKTVQTRRSRPRGTNTRTPTHHVASLLNVIPIHRFINVDYRLDQLTCTKSSPICDSVIGQGLEGLGKPPGFNRDEVAMHWWKPCFT